MTFLLFVFFASSLMHAYLIVRLGALDWLRAARRRAGRGLFRWVLAGGVVCCWLVFPLASFLERVSARPGFVLAVAGAVWFGTIFLAFTWTLVVDGLTGFGAFMSASRGRTIRRAGALVGVTFAAAALVQGLRPPVVRDVEVPVAGLRTEYDGLVITQVTDLHLGEILGPAWLEARVRQVEATRPSLIAVTGDLMNLPWQAEPLVPALRQLQAPLGVWAVTGNHEYYGGLAQSVRVMRQAGFRVLQDEAAEVTPGLVVAGVDDLTARREVAPEVLVTRALARRPKGTTIFLSHTPWGAERAAASGVALMLSGHTHDGQIWPFRYLVRLLYPRIAGRYTMGDMTLVISRGTGFWGPPMRLFHRGEILRITLRPAS